MIESQNKRKIENGEGKLRNGRDGGKRATDDGESAGVPPTGLLMYLHRNTHGSMYHCNALPL